MQTFSHKFILLLTIMISCMIMMSRESSAQAQKGYLEGLFEEIEAREKKPETAPPRVYGELIKGALSFKLLDKYPKLRIGKIQFSSQLPPDLKRRAADIKKGQELILDYIASPDMLHDSLTFKELIDEIDHKFGDTRSKLQYTDWVLMASAFRTLSAPNSKEQFNALGIFVTEYIILMLINELEQKTDRTKEEDKFLSSLYYILSQIYQNIINNPDKYYFIQKKKEGKSAPLYFSLPKIYYTDAYYEGEYIEPITHLTIYTYDIPYHDPTSYAIFLSFDVTYDRLLSRRLDLLRIAVIVTPYYDIAWVPIIEYIVIDLRSPFYQERLSPVFWDDYFPYGIIGIEPVFIDRLYNQWERIRREDPRALRQAVNPTRITNSLREMRSPTWRREQEKREERGIQERLRRILPEERREERRLREERQEQRSLQQEQERLRRREQRQEERQLQQEQRRLQQEQEKLHRREQREERRLREEKIEERQLQQEQRRLQQEQEKLHRREQREKREVEKTKPAEPKSKPVEKESEPQPPQKKEEPPRLQSEGKGGSPKEKGEDSKKSQKSKKEK